MTFVAIPDTQVDGSSTAALESRFGSPVEVHASGRPWIFADQTTVRLLQRRFVAGERHVRLGASEAKVVPETADDASGWRLISREKSSEAQGSLSSSHRICWTTRLGTVLISDRADTLAAIVGSRVDPTQLMLAMCESLSSLPFAASSYWQDISVLLPHEILRISPSRVQRERWWRPPAADLSLEETAGEVRSALRSAILGATARAGSVSCDLSGGLDSTSLVFLLNDVGVDFSTFNSFSHDARNMDREWAHRTLDRLGRDQHTELTSSSETLRAFGHTDVTGKTDEPLLWKSNIAYLQELAVALEANESPVHMNGLGGDELFTFLPGALHAAWRAGLPGRRRLVARARAMNRWGGPETRRMLRQDSAFSEHLRSQGADVAAGVSPIGPDVCSWLPPVRVSRFATSAARSVIVDALRGVPTDQEPHARTHGHHQVMEGVNFQGSIVRTVNQLFGHSMTWEAPILDQPVITARLRMLDGLAGPEGVAKPLLAHVMAPIMPGDYFTRRDKGDYSHDVYREFAERRSQLRDFFEDSLLAELGVLDLNAVNQVLESGTQNNADLFDLERVVELERWYRTTV